MEMTHKILPPGPIDVESWRWEQLIRAGVGQEVAEYLCGTTADLYDMLKAHHAGCSDEHLQAIFSDLHHVRPRARSSEAEHDSNKVEDSA